MDSMFTVLGVLGGWIVLQVWVLPRLGVPTGAVPQPRVSRQSKPHETEDGSIESRKN